MTIELKLTDCTAEDLEEIAPALVQAMKNKLKNLKAEAKAAAKIPEVQPDLPPVETEEPAPLQEVPTYDLEAVRGLLNSLKQDKGTEVVRTVLEKFGVKRVPDIPADMYPAVVDLIAKCYEEAQ